jgi:hypothetical protein
MAANMLTEVGASGQISLGVKYAGKLIAESCIEFMLRGY